MESHLQTTSMSCMNTSLRNTNSRFIGMCFQCFLCELKIYQYLNLGHHSPRNRHLIQAKQLRVNGRFINVDVDRILCNVYERKFSVLQQIASDTYISASYCNYEHATLPMIFQKCYWKVKLMALDIEGPKFCRRSISQLNPSIKMQMQYFFLKHGVSSSLK